MSRRELWEEARLCAYAGIIIYCSWKIGGQMGLWISVLVFAVLGLVGVAMRDRR